MRYLSDFDVKANLRAGRTVEQLLQDRREADQLVIRYISIERDSKDRWKVRLCEVFDNGKPEFIDIYEFEALEPDFPFGEEWIFDSVESAMEFSGASLDAAPDHYVNQGLIQDEYKDRYHPDW
ncbi:hypothetical protein GGR79_000236 [Xanthomonas arboricola]|uniref:hypothetical protein n=1 Tax=Xanthomonas arboricola TaxID=56448 RepID=UPI00142FA97B|nr:hypothetical protein [Xanthomonas arboricola]NJC28769.1 hypothetical protein [Xanthomonas arboricola]